jgi:hypothetical protein
VTGDRKRNSSAFLSQCLAFTSSEIDHTRKDGFSCTNTQHYPRISSKPDFLYLLDVRQGMIFDLCGLKNLVLSLLVPSMVSYSSHKKVITAVLIPIRGYRQLTITDIVGHSRLTPSSIKQCTLPVVSCSATLMLLELASGLDW